MGKIKKFPKKMAELDATNSLEEINYMHALLNSKQELIQYLIEDSKERLKPINRVIGKMELIDDNFTEQLCKDEYPITFLFRSKTGYDYMVTLDGPDEEEDDEDVECVMEFTLTHPLQDGFEVYDWDNDSWSVFNMGGRWVEDILKEDSTRNSYLNCILETRFADFKEFTNESFEAMCQENKPLLDLYEYLDGLVDFDSILVNTKLDSVIGLVPDDVDIVGVAVRYENGKFRILQYLEDVSIFFACEEAQADYPDSEFLYVPVYTCENVEKAGEVLRMVLDHYYRDETFVFPLSDRHYIRTSNPFLSLDNVMGSDGELTEKEKMRVRYLESFFDCA